MKLFPGKIDVSFEKNVFMTRADIDTIHTSSWTLVCENSSFVEVVAEEVINNSNHYLLNSQIVRNHLHFLTRLKHKPGLLRSM